MTRSRTTLLTAGVVLSGIALLLAQPAPAGAHAVLSDSVPARGDTVTTAPTEIVLRFTEPPVADARIAISDGCDRDVVQGIEVLNAELTVAATGGQPGKWRVRYQVVSAVDGHSTSGTFSFEVAGSADCAAAVPSQPAPGPDSPAGGSSLLPLLIGSALVVIASIAGGAWLRRGET